ncbi:MAG: polyprenyl synthetase family protein [Promethearchaeota archaeon]
MIEEFLNKEKLAIDIELDKYFNHLDEIENEILLKDFISQLKEFIVNKKAKRLHPILLIASFTGIINPIYLNEQLDQLRKVSLAMELLHSGHLIHDDLIDEEEERRSKPTFYFQLKRELERIYKNLDFGHKDELIKMYGRDMSILGGTHGYLLGLDVIKNSKFPNNLKLLAINEYTEAMDFLIKGHILEEYMHYHNLTMTLEQYLNIAEMQRARLFEKSAKIGAILAKGNLHYQIQPLSEALLRIGQAYAIRDDILDVNKDIRSKIKKNFVYILAIQNSDENQSKQLNEIYHKGSLSKEDVKIVERLFAETNSVITAEHFSKNLVSQAKNFLKDIYPDLNKQQKLFFNEFADYIYMREF